MEARRAIIRLTYGTESSSTARRTRFETTKSRICVYKVASDPGKNFKKHFQKMKEKPEIQVQILQPDQISGVLWVIIYVYLHVYQYIYIYIYIYIWIMLFQGRNSILRTTIFRYGWIILMYRDQRKQDKMCFKRRDYWNMDGDKSLDRCDTIRAAHQKPTTRIYVCSRQTEEETGHNKTSEHLARRMAKCVKGFTA